MAVEGLAVVSALGGLAAALAAFTAGSKTAFAGLVATAAVGGGFSLSLGSALVLADAGSGDWTVPLGIFGAGGAVGASVAYGLVKGLGDTFYRPWLESQTRGLRADNAGLQKTVAELTLKVSSAERAMREGFAMVARLAEGALRQRGEQRDDAAVIRLADGPPVLDGPRVLLVEDDPTVSAAMRVILEICEGRYQVEAVATLAEALTLLETVSYEVVLLDLMLPGGADGCDLLRRVRERGLACRVIVTTGKHESLLGPVRELRPDGLLYKPIDFQRDLAPLLPPRVAAPLPPGGAAA